MKYLFLILAMVGFSVSADSNKEVQRYIELCDSIGNLSAEIVRAKQRGMSITSVHEVLRNVAADDALSEFRTILVIEAYKLPSYQSSQLKQAQVDKFKNDALSGCLEALL